MGIMKLKHTLMAVTSGLAGLVAYSSIMALTTAKGGGTPPPRPAVCANPLACTQETTRLENACNFGDENFVQMHSFMNRHPNRDLIVSYNEIVRHLNSGRPDEVFPKIITISAGRKEDVGCEKTRGFLAENIDHWSFPITSACFADDCKGTSTGPGAGQKPEPRNPAVSCEDECAQGSPNCIFYSLRNGTPGDQVVASEFRRLTEVLLHAPAPFSYPMDNFAAIMTQASGETCSRNPIDVPNEYSLLNSGNRCNLPVGVTGPGDVSGVVMHFPGAFRNQLERQEGDYARIASTDVGTSMWIDIHGVLPDDQIYSERLIGGTFYRDHLIMTGERRYCVALEY